MKRASKVALAMLLVAALTVPVAAAGAETERLNPETTAAFVLDGPDVVDEDDPGPPLEELEAVSYAKDYGVSVDEAARRLRRAVQLDDVIAEIVRGEGERVAGYSIVHEPEFGAWIYLVGDGQPAARTLEIQGSEGDVMIETGARNSLDELVAAADSKRELLSVLPDHMRSQIVSTDIDIFNNTFVVAIDEAASSSRTPTSSPTAKFTPDEAAQELQTILSAHSNVAVTVTTGSRTATNAIHGGENLWRSNNRSCTSAFAVKKGNARGLTSAGHCERNSTTIERHYRSRNLIEAGKPWFAVTLEERIFGDPCDCLWYTPSNGEWVSDNFYTSTGSTRDVVDYESRLNMNGDYVCHYGIASNYSCGTVTSVYFDPDYQPECGWWGCHNIWVKVEGPSLEACNQDSGGPWFQYRTAYGVHSGSDTPGGGNCSAAGTQHAVFMAMDTVLVRLDVDFVTT